MRSPLLAILLLLGVCSSFAWVNLEAVRSIDVRTHVENVVLQVKVKNDEDKPSQSYLVAVPAEKAKHLAFVSAAVNDQITLTVTPVSSKDEKAPVDTVFYKVTLNKPVSPGGVTEFSVYLSFTHVLEPFPASITQEQSQLVVYRDSMHVFSPYPTVAQSTGIKLASSSIESYTRTSATLKQDSITYGPFNDVAPYSSSPFRVHYENNSPFITLTKAQRLVEVSHYGNIAVEGRYEIANTGATLKGPFSRQVYQRALYSGKGPSFRNVVAQLPAGASDIWYRDHIGNISTSHVRETSKSVVVELDPRFPMMGGWKTDFKLGYNIPASPALAVVEDSPNTYLLTIEFGVPFGSVVVDDYQLAVSLPEHATSIRWRSSHFHVDSAEVTSRISYLDFSGRPTLLLKKKNVISAHTQPIQISYEWSPVAAYQKPLLLVSAWFVFFLVSMAYMRLSLSLGSRTVHAKTN